jgi:hypothetical protein
VSMSPFNEAAAGSVFTLYGLNPSMRPPLISGGNLRRRSSSRKASIRQSVRWRRTYCPFNEAAADQRRK